MSDFMIELEKTFLARELPKGLKSCKSKEVVDIYFPKEAKHPTIRVRKNGLHSAIVAINWSAALRIGKYCCGK